MYWHTLIVRSIIFVRFTFVLYPTGWVVSSQYWAKITWGLLSQDIQGAKGCLMASYLHLIQSCMYCDQQIAMAIVNLLFNVEFLQVFAPNEKIENINDQYWTLRAEEVCYFMLHNYTGVEWFISPIYHWLFCVLFYRFQRRRKTLVPLTAWFMYIILQKILKTKR